MKVVSKNQVQTKKNAKPLFTGRKAKVDGFEGSGESTAVALAFRKKHNAALAKRGGGKRVPKVSGRGTEFINPRDSSTDNILSFSLPVTPLTLNSTLEAVTGVGVAAMSYAVQKGFNTFAPIPDYPYWALLYCNGIVASAMKSTSYQTQILPLWLRNICDAVCPTHVKIGSGELAYNWNITFDVTTQSWLIDEKPTGMPRSVNFGLVTTAQVNNIFHEIAAPAAYTADNGAAAWSCLLEFYQQKGGDQSWARLVQPGTGTSQFMGDASAFAMYTKNFGNSGTDCGAYGKTVASEVPFKYPQLAVFAALAPGSLNDSARYPSYLKNASGDTVAAAGMMCSGFNPKCLSSGIAPIYKPVDFLRFVETLAMWYTEAVRLAVADGLNQDAMNNTPGMYELGMTLQEFELLVRNLVMNNFAATQFLAQNMYPADSFNNPNPFLPFVCGVGTCAVDVPGMAIPQLFAENLRSLTYITQTGSNPITYIPVIGKYALFELDWENYTYQKLGNETVYHIFTDPATAVKRKTYVTEKGSGNVKETVAFGAEQVISVVDGSTGSNYVAINAPYAMEQLTNIWNAKIDQIKTFTDTITMLGTDAGIKVLRMVNITTVHFMNQEGHASLPGGKKVVKRDIPRRLIVNAGFNNESTPSPYESVMVYAQTFFDNPIAQAWQLFQHFWIASDIELRFQGQGNEILTVQKWQALVREYVNISYTSGDDQFTLFQKTVEYVQCMLKVRDGEKSFQNVFLVQMEVKYGRGGILSSLVGGLVSAIIPGSKKVVDTIAGFIPI